MMEAQGTYGSLEALVVGPSTSLTDCARVVRYGGAGIALIADDTGRLLGTMTDGDVRRALLRGQKMDSLAVEAMEKSPHSALAGTPRARCMEIMRQTAIFQLPLVDSEGRIVDLALLAEEGSSADRQRHAVVIAGGLGTRLGDLTKETPKPMLLVGGRPILQGIVEQLIAAGYGRITLSVNYLAAQIETHFGDGARFGVEIDYVREKTKLGTAGCLSLLSRLSAKEILVINGDIVTDIDFAAMAAFHRDTGGAATVAVHQYHIDVPYGVVDTDKHTVVGFTEKPRYGFFVSAGIYILSGVVVGKVPHDQYCDMPTLLSDAMQDGMTVSAFPLHEYWLDVGRPHDLDRANAMYDSIFSAGDAPS